MLHKTNNCDTIHNDEREFVLFRPSSRRLYLVLIIGRGFLRHCLRSYEKLYVFIFIALSFWLRECFFILCYNHFVKPSDFELIKQPKPNGVWVQDNSKDFNDYFDYELTSYQGLYRIYRLTTKELQLRFYLERENGVMYEGFWKTTINPNLTLYYGAL